jgi:hypothetical protein
MEIKTKTQKTASRNRLLKQFFILILLFLVSLSCTFSTETSSDDDLEATQIALGIQQTLVAQQAGNSLQETLDAQQATIDAQAMQATLANQQPTVDLAATQVAQSVQGTMAAGQPTPNIPTGPTQAPPTLAPPSVSNQDLETFMKSANILLYEDMVNDPKVYRYVKRTLDGMGLVYKDDGSAKGWLKNDLLSGARGGVPWDLVIIAVEYRAGISGEYFDYLMDVLNQGSSVIVEAYHLDQISQGTVSTILTKCGIQVYPYVGKTRTLVDLLIWPISGADHPILKEPNSGLSFSKAVAYWPYNDLGDLVALTGQGDAQILMGTKANERARDGVLTTCMNGQFTLMSFSSHSYSFQTVSPLWENMITQALKVRMATK